MGKLNDGERLLNELRNIMLQNPNFKLTRDNVYWYLSKFGMYGNYEDIIKNKYFDKWISNFKNKNNINVFWDPNWKHFCQFTNGWLGSDYIKVYLAIDEIHIEESVNRIFNYLAQENIFHQSKVASKERNDGIIIRLDGKDINGLNKLISYIENDSYIKEGMRKVNPFLPTIKSVGVMKDDGESYNGTLSEIISEYMNAIDLTQPINMEHFIKYVSNTFLLKDNILGYKCFQDAYNMNFGLEDLKYETYELVSVENFPLEKLTLATFEKYNKPQAIRALIESTKGNFEYFTRYEMNDTEKRFDLRKIVIENMKPEEIRKHIYTYSGLDTSTDLEVACSIYFDKILYQTKGVILDNAIKVTALKFNDSKQAIEKRLNDYIQLGKTEVFSSYGNENYKGYNFRKAVSMKVLPSQVLDVIDSILNNALNYNNHRRNSNISEYSNLVRNQLNLSPRKI